MKSKRVRFSSKATDARISFKATAADAPKPGTIGTLIAYPLVWNSLSSDRGGYSVRLVKGSATFTTPALALYNHHFGRLLGNSANGTMRVAEPDEYGQKVEIDLPDTSDGRDVAALVVRRDIKGMSFTMANGFEESFQTEEAGRKIVNATRYTVDEVSVVVDPAFQDTSVEMLDDKEDDGADDPNFSGKEKELKASRAKFDANRLYHLLLT